MIKSPRNIFFNQINFNVSNHCYYELYIGMAIGEKFNKLLLHKNFILLSSNFTIFYSSKYYLNKMQFIYI